MHDAPRRTPTHNNRGSASDRLHNDPKIKNVIDTKNGSNCQQPVEFFEKITTASTTKKRKLNQAFSRLRLSRPF